MKRDYKFFLTLAGSLPLSLNALFFSLPAASEEAQTLPSSETISRCPDKLPILEADQGSMGTEASPGSSGNPSRSDSEAVVLQTVINADQISRTTPKPESNQSLSTSEPLTGPQIEPPTLPRSQPTVLPAPLNKPSVEPLAGSIIPASPLLPRAVAPSSTSTEDLAPHTRYLPVPPDPSPITAASVVAENQPTRLDPDAPVNQPSEPPTTIGCAPALNSAQDGVLPQTANTEKPSQSSKNSDIEKSMENAQRSLKGFRPF